MQLSTCCGLYTDSALALSVDKRLTNDNTIPALTSKCSLQVLEEAGEEGLTSAEINKRVIDRRPRGCPPHSVRGERSRVSSFPEAHVARSWQAKQCLHLPCMLCHQPFCSSLKLLRTYQCLVIAVLL